MTEQLHKAIEILERQRAPLLREITYNEGRARTIAPQLYYVNLLLLQLKEEVKSLKADVPRGVGRPKKES